MSFNEFEEKNSFEEKPLTMDEHNIEGEQNINNSITDSALNPNDESKYFSEIKTDNSDSTNSNSHFSGFENGYMHQSQVQTNKYRQYSEYSNRMHVRQPIDASYRPQYQNLSQDQPYHVPVPEKEKKKNGFLIAVTIICVVLSFSLGAVSLYAIANSRLGALIGFGISNALGQTNESILPGGITNSDLNESVSRPDGVENPPSFDIVSVVPSEIPKVYDKSGREILNASQIYEKVSPCVVSITTKISTDYGLGYTTASGSGIIFSEDGYIISNAHVVSGSTTINVFLSNDADVSYSAEIIGIDTKADLAVLKIDAEGLNCAEFGDSDALKIGDMAVAIGNPTTLDLQGATTQGIISGLNREIVVDDNGRTLNLIQTDAAINPGNSGGPLINCYGQVIGINTVGLKSASYEGLNFAIPSNIMKPIVEELLMYGYVKGYPSIGITGKAVSAYQAQMYGVPLGVIVATVHENSDAAKKGLQTYDIITHINGQSISSIADLNTIKNHYVVGNSIILSINRDGKSFDIEIVLMDESELQ